MTVATDPTLRSWVAVPEGSGFPIQNIPFGIFRAGPGDRPRPGVAIGDHILDLRAVSESGVMRLRDEEANAATLNTLLETPGRLGAIRQRVSQLLTLGNDELAILPNRGLVARDDVQLMAPIAPGDFVDFYSSEAHATNLGRMFRPDSDALLPNWKHLPVGYHGRTASVVVSGTPIRRPRGQRSTPGGPVYGPSTRLDFELELGFAVSGSTPTGSTVAVRTAADHIAGFLLVNDWSARDIQAWEYVPLGPFLGKSFATTVSPWLVTPEALEPFRIPAPSQQPPPLPHLAVEPNPGLDIELEVALNGTIISRTNARELYWTPIQQLAHATSNGAGIRPGDLFASGTISGWEVGSYGSLIELSDNGRRPLTLDDGSTRGFLEDGDVVILRGWCDNGRVRIGFGECAGSVLPATETEERT